MERPSPVICFVATLFLMNCVATDCVRADRRGDCFRAHSNAEALAGAQIGMTSAQVLDLTGRQPDSRDVTQTSEVWYYLIDDRSGAMSAITFQAGKVSRIRTVQPDSITIR
jgi:hypothetical protein